MKRVVLMSCFLAVATEAAAATIIWEAFGTVTNITYANFLGGGSTPPPGWTRVGPPIGTPFSLELRFDPTNLLPTPQVLSPSNPECSFTPVQAIMSLGTFSYSASGGAFTNALFPGTNCYTGGVLRAPGSTEFFFSRMITTDPGAFSLDEDANFLSAVYYDTNHQHGTIATVPAPARAGLMYFQNMFFNFSAPFTPIAAEIDQPAAVPEPATMTLVGIGLAFAARRRFRR